MAISLLTVAWLVTVPGVLTLSSFLAIVGILIAFGWIVAITHRNAQPASSLAQSLYDVDQSDLPPNSRQKQVSGAAAGQHQVEG